MGTDSCPRCWEPLTVRDVSPCFLCGAWDPKPRADTEFMLYHLPSGGELVLCTMCYLEDICSDQSDVPALLDVGELDLIAVGSVERHSGEVDKYCEQCGLRLSLLKLVKS